MPHKHRPSGFLVSVPFLQQTPGLAADGINSETPPGRGFGMHRQFPPPISCCKQGCGWVAGEIDSLRRTPQAQQQQLGGGGFRSPTQLKPTVSMSFPGHGALRGTRPKPPGFGGNIYAAEKHPSWGNSWGLCVSHLRQANVSPLPCPAGSLELAGAGFESRLPTPTL